LLREKNAVKHIIQKRRILVGLSGGIACYKGCDLVSRLVQLGAEVRVVMTPNATRFVGPLSLQALSGSPVYTDMFDLVDPGGIDHIRLAEFAEIFVILPATADVLAKMAHGLADDLLSTTYIACNCPVLAAAAMETKMYNHPATQANLKLLEKRGVQLLHPETGYLASGKKGVGRLPGRERIIERIALLLGASSRLAGKTVLVTAGPTREALDPVRFLSNPSTGKMGFALARAAVRMGARDVHLVTGPAELDTPFGVKRRDVVSAADMLKAVKPLARKADLIIAAAAVSDFAPLKASPKKVKKSSMGEKPSLPLCRTEDILAYASKNRKKGALVVGFAVETENEIRNATEKLKKKALDYIVVNNPLSEGSGFGSETNRAVILDAGGGRVELPLISKDELAERLLELVSGKPEK
jgi:phosphopantothenoylcysteine decarboxylase/phosphopantothenate--cysteine ligase